MECPFCLGKIKEFTGEDGELTRECSDCGEDLTIMMIKAQDAHECPPDDGPEAA